MTLYRTISEILVLVYELLEVTWPRTDHQ